MKREILYKTIYNILSFFRNQCKKVIGTLIIPVNQIQGERFNSVATIPDSRQVGKGFVKTLRRPVARNDILRINDSHKCTVRAKNKDVFSIFDFLCSNKKQ